MKTNIGTDVEVGAEAATKVAEAPKPSSIKLDAMLLGILKKKAEAGQATLDKHIANVAMAYGCEAIEVTTAFEAALAAEKAAAEAEAKAKRISAKRAKADAWVISNLNTFTVPKSVIVLLQKAQEEAKTLCDADSQVTMVPVFGLNEKGEPTVTLSSTGLNAPTAARASSGDGTTSEKSRVSPWVAYNDGVKKGDTFRITKLAAGRFRDETRGADIPPKGFTKWIRSYYAESHTAAILKKYGQL